ncbi:MAG TPA: anti-sigma factor [Pyrinomonadaceae bacterium]|nr:anti-sigma factor [Pyrinomonadaceae bacterium]
MTNERNIINCTRFEELLTDYLDRTLDSSTVAAVGEHALSCPLCHTLLNDVKESLEACKAISTPKVSMTRLEARVISMTVPETAMSCAEFEEYLTDYMDGFIPASLFHRWERHAVLCNVCTDLPGMVVRSIAACYTYKMDELAVPEGLHERILRATLGTTEVKVVKPSFAAAWVEWVRGLRFPLPVPQLAPVALLLLIAFMVFGQTVSANGSITDVYQKGFELAEQTYLQSADAWNGNSSSNQIQKQEPTNGTTYVTNEEQKQ